MRLKAAVRGWIDTKYRHLTSNHHTQHTLCANRRQLRDGLIQDIDITGFMLGCPEIGICMLSTPRREQIYTCFNIQVSRHSEVTPDTAKMFGETRRIPEPLDMHIFCTLDARLKIKVPRHISSRGALRAFERNYCSFSRTITEHKGNSPLQKSSQMVLIPKNTRTLQR